MTELERAVAGRTAYPSARLIAGLLLIVSLITLSPSERSGLT
jgi:hypothetical protein